MITGANYLYRGLNTVNLSTLNTVQQIMLFILIIIGSAIFVSGFVIHVRKRCFERKFESIVRKAREDAARGRGLSLSRTLSRTFSRSQARAIPEDGTLTEHDGFHEDKQEPDSQPQSGIGDSFEGTTQENQNINDHEACDPSSSLSAGKQAPNHSAADDELSQPPGNELNISRTRSTGNRNDISTFDHQGPDENHLHRLNTAIGDRGASDHITFGPDVYFRRYSDTDPTNKHRLLAMQGVGAHPSASIKRRRGSHSATRSDHRAESRGGGSARAGSFPNIENIARNSQFHHLSEAEREKLGGYEYRALQFLSWVVPAYFVLWQLLGCLGIGAYVAINKPSVARRNGMSPWYV